MFNRILISEFEKFWSKKVNLIAFLVMPLGIICGLKYLLERNMHYDLSSHLYTSVYNFPVALLSEILITLLNAIVIIFCATTFNEDYMSGNLRTTFTKGASFKKVFLAKYIVVISNIFIMLLFYLIFSYSIGFIFLPRINEVYIYTGIIQKFSPAMSFFICARSVFVAFITLCVVASIAIFISLIVRNIVITIGTNIGILILNMLIVILISNTNINYLIRYFSFVFAQFEGLAIFFLSTKFALYSTMILVLQFIIFSTLSYFCFTKRDYIH